MLRLLIVDDHLIVRQGLKHLVESSRDDAITAETCSSQEVIKLLHKNAHDVILLGIALSRVDHIELLKEIKTAKLDLPVLIVSVSDDEQYCGRLLRAGASGILTQNSNVSELATAIMKISRGRKYVTPSLAEKLDDFSTEKDLQLQDALSDREYEVLVSIVSGKRIKQIADGMSLSIKTVSTYHSRILQKLKIDNDAQLIRYAIGHGIIRDNAVAREKLLLTELNIRTAPVIASVREIWRQRKAVIIVVGILAILVYIFLTYAVRFLF